MERLDENLPIRATLGIDLCVHARGSRYKVLTWHSAYAWESASARNWSSYNKRSKSGRNKLESLPLRAPDPMKFNISRKEAFFLRTSWAGDPRRCSSQSCCELPALQLATVEQPPLSDGLGDELGQWTITDHYEATKSNAVGRQSVLP